MSVRAPWYYVALIPEGGKGEPVDLSARVTAFEYEDHESKTDKLKLTVNNFDLSNFDDPLFRHGARLQVAWGSGVDTAPIREVIVRSVKGGIELTVEADDRAVEMDTIKKSRTFEYVTRSDVVRQLAQENGYDEPDIEDTEELFPIISQCNLSDAQMIRKMAHLEGCEFFVDFDGFHWHRRRVGQAPLRTLTYYAANPEAAGDIISFSVENDITRKPGRIRVKSRDPMTKQDIEAVADNETDTDRHVLQSYTATIDGESGDVTGQKHVSYEETRPSNVESQKDADVEAKGSYRKAQQVAVKMKLELRGMPSLLAKSVVTIDGLGKRLSGKYYVKAIRHSLSGGGAYVCSAELITDGYRAGYGSKGSSSGDGTEDALLASLANALRSAAGELTDTPMRAQLTASLSKLAKQVEAIIGQSGSARAASAKSTANFAAAVSQAASKTKDTPAALVAADVATTLRRITAQEDAKAAGNVNTKDESDAGTLTEVKRIDPETGDEVKDYVSKRGRDG